MSCSHNRNIGKPHDSDPLRARISAAAKGIEALGALLAGNRVHSLRTVRVCLRLLVRLSAQNGPQLLPQAVCPQHPRNHLNAFSDCSKTIMPIWSV